MKYTYTGSDDDDDDDLLVEFCGKDLQALKDACHLYDDDEYGEFHTDVKDHDNENDKENVNAPADSTSCHSDAVLNDNEEDDDDALLLSIQRRFGSFQNSSGQTQEINESYEEEDDDAILEAVQRRFFSSSTDMRKKRSSIEGKGSENARFHVKEENTNQKLLASSQGDVGDQNVSSPTLSYDGYDSQNDLSPQGPGEIPDDAANDTEEGVSDVSYEGVMLSKNFFSGSQRNNIRNTINALKKNRLLQKVLTNKLRVLQSKLRENADLKKRVRVLIDFQNAAKRRSAMEIVGRLPASFCSAMNAKDKQHLVSWGSRCSRNRPIENPDVAKFRLIQKKYYLTCEPRSWSRDEKKALVKGVIQQIQESRMRAAMEIFNNDDNDAGCLDDQVKNITEGSISPQDIRASLHLVNWNEVARIYVSGRSPVDCWIQWANYEDPLIYHGPWTKMEDKCLWSIAKEHRLCNWESIANSLGTRRSVAQCLIRYQRSLNAGIMRSTWTPEEDVQLRAAVQLYGDQDWSAVAATLEGRTGPQCWNRWNKILHPTRKKSGRWDTLEDKRLRLAVSVYGPRMWKVIAAHVPGRTEAQCRERWCNVLDPSLTSAEWTQEEDYKLEEAVSKHGQHKWSLVANELKPRTDNQCWRRWKHLHPEHISTFRKTNKIQKAALINNFVGRKKERPKLGPSDFIPEDGAFSDEEVVFSKSRKRRRTNFQDEGARKRQQQISEIGGIIVDAEQHSSVAMISPELYKLRRAERMQKLREARAHGKWQVPKRTEAKKASTVRTNLGEKQIKGKNTAASFVRFVSQLAQLCTMRGPYGDNLKDNAACAAGDSNANDSQVSLSRFSALSDNSIQQVEAAVKSVLSWPFLQGLQELSRKPLSG